MLRIAKLGAPTRGEALIYRSANKTFSKDFLIAEAEDHGFELSTMPEKKYRQQIGYKYGLIDNSGEAESKKVPEISFIRLDQRSRKDNDGRNSSNSTDW